MHAYVHIYVQYYFLSFIIALKRAMASSSRHRLDNATIFDVCCEVESANDSEPTTKKNTKIKVLYPLEFSDENILRSIQQFCFPLDSVMRSENEAVQLFTFVLTDAQSRHSFGFCRYTPRTKSCFCVLSGFLWVNFFYKLLNTISFVINNGNVNDVESLLTNAYHLDIPAPGAKLQLSACSNIGRFSEHIPDPQRLPTLREDKFLLEFFNAINERQMIQLYASLLKERRIIFTSSKLSQLSACLFGISKLFYPFIWQNLFIPILPHDLTDMLMAPMPYLIGVPRDTFRRQNKAELGDVVVMDVDDKLLTSPYEDKLPVEVHNFLRGRLKLSSDIFLSDALARAFVQTNVLLFGNYLSGLVMDPRGSYSWDRKLFVDKQRSSLRPFLSTLIGKDGVQYLERFIDEKVSELNDQHRTTTIDEFEREAQAMGVRGCGLLDTKNSTSAAGMPTDVLHQAVSSVKENATDVIGALKDQIHSLSVRNKLNVVKTRREKGGGGGDNNGIVMSSSNKRRRPSSSVVRSRLKYNKPKLDPLTIDAAQFNLGKLSSHHPVKTRSVSPPSIENAQSVGDLIDLSSDASPHDRNLRPPSHSIASNIFSSPNLLSISQFDPSPPLLPPVVVMSSSPSADHHHHSSSFDIDTLSSSNSSALNLPSNSSLVNNRRNNWETFE